MTSSHTCYCVFQTIMRVLNCLRSQFCPQELLTQLLEILYSRKYIWEYSEPLPVFFF